MNLRENEKSRTIDKNVFNSFFDFKFDLLEKNPLAT